MKNAPIGVFDSGIGGLSILKALRAELPHESFIYIADSGNAPYGEKGDDFVIARSRALTRTLIDQDGITKLRPWSSPATPPPPPPSSCCGRNTPTCRW